MPRPRNSIAQADLKGTLQQNAGRYASRQDAPVTKGDVGKAPSYFSTEKKKIWREVILSIPVGVAGESDRQTVELACTLLHQFRMDPTMSTARIALLLSTLSILGMTPQGRTKLHTTEPAKKKETDTVSKFMSAAKSHGRDTIQ